MVTLAAGMESDFSDSDCDIVFSTDKEIKLKEDKYVKPEPPKTSTANGTIGNSARDSRKFNPRNFSKFRQQNGNRNQQHTRRPCLDFNSSQILDDLRYAIMQNNLENTKNILSKGIWVDTILKAGWTGLMYACSSGHPDIVAYLLQEKADPNYHRDMFTPLMAACASKKSEEDLIKCCSLLIEHGAKINAHERHYTTPLMFASREGYSLIVKLLLEHGADLNLQDNRGKTALAWAASAGHGQILRLLIEKGADVNIVNNMGQSAVDVAYEAGYNEVVSLLQKGLQGTSVTETSTDLVPKKPSELGIISKLNRNSDAKSFTKVGELELFLSGVGVQELIPKFLEHQLKFHDVLVMDDEELEKIGIHQVGVRKKILDACKSVHKKEWESSSLPNLKQSQYISCPDAVAMMANIAKHLKYISSSVIYIRQQIQSQPRILELSQDSANVHNLVDEMDDSLKNVRFLNDELRFLKMHLEKVQDQVQYIPADLIVETVPGNQRQRRLILAAIGITALSAAVAGILWRNPNALDTIPTSFKIKNPFLS